MTESTTPIELAERVATIARGLGIESALIGAYALAAHHFVRGSSDIDLGTMVQLQDLWRLKRAVEEVGLQARLSTPDEQDDLGGVLQIWNRVDEDGDPIEPLDVVNFLNPYRPRRTPASDAIRNAESLPDNPSLRCPRLADLVALKLDAGGPRDRADVVDLLVVNTDADLDEIRTTCAKYGLEVEPLIAQADAMRARAPR